MKLVAILKLIRFKNLFLILYVQILLKFFLFSSYNISTNLTIIQFVILIISILLIASAGYVINDLVDLKTDLINKPQKVVVTKFISIEKAKKIYFWCNSLGVILGIGLSLNIEKPTYSFIFIGSSLLLYYYSKKFKSKPLIGNLIVSFLTMLNILILYAFDISKPIKINTQEVVISVIIIVSFFSFFFNLTREIVKDIEDINGDYNLNMKTLPIVIGEKRAKNFAVLTSIIPLGILLFLIINYASHYKFTVLYLLFFVLSPLLFIISKLLFAKSKRDYKKISNLLKIIMFLGINSLLIFSINQ